MSAKRDKKSDVNYDVEDLEIKDPNLVFNTVWDELVTEVGEENLQFPKEIFWLNGAPGAGKGTHTRFIMKHRDYTAAPIVVSDLLKSEEARKRIDAGHLVGDREVTSSVIRKLLEPTYRNGVIIDGYPRTQVQVECLKQFHNKLHELNVRHAAVGRTNFHIIVLFIDEGESVRRQLERGQKAKEYNKKVKESKVGKLLEIRKTDSSKKAAINRYRTFIEQTYDSLQSLQEVFRYHYINAQGTIKEVQRRIVEELKYQSSLELAHSTFERLRKIPLPSQMVVHARQELIARLDNYEAKHRELFQKVVKLVEAKFIPIIVRHAISGRAQVNSEDSLLDDHLALAMLIDVFSERGYHAVVDVCKEEIPDSLDLQTGKIKTRIKRVYRARFRFKGSEIRRSG